MLSLAAGEIVLLRGPNGCGKTTLLRQLAGLETPWADDGPGPRPGPRWASFAMQDARDGLVGLTVAGEFRFRRAHAPPHLEPLEERDLMTLSSGEARRVALAVADRDTPVLLLDEPAEGLDEEGRGMARALVRRAAERGASVVAADHAGIFDDLATRIVDLAPSQEDAPLPDVPRGRDGSPVVAAWGPGLHALVGPNGSGKTTLLRSLVGDGVRFAPTHPVFTRGTVRDECSGGASARLVPAALLDRHPLTLSGGEAQRVSLARTLGRVGARAYLLDEPEAHLDAAGRCALVALIAARVAEGACVVAATHDDRLVERAQSVVSLR